MRRHHGSRIQAWLLRGVKTLPLRMEQRQENARNWPASWRTTRRSSGSATRACESHPQHALANEQMHGPGALMSFGVQGRARRRRDPARQRGSAGPGGQPRGHRIVDRAPGQHDPRQTAARRNLLEAPDISDDLVRIAGSCESYEDMEADGPLGSRHDRPEREPQPGTKVDLDNVAAGWTPPGSAEKTIGGYMGGGFHRPPHARS